MTISRDMGGGINHKQTHEVVCPHCGWTHEDSWERRMVDGDVADETCDKCGCEFTITYDTEKAVPDEY